MINIYNKREFAEDMATKIAERYNGELDFNVVTVPKQGNITLTGIQLRLKDSKVVPIVYVDNIYERWADGELCFDNAQDALFDMIDDALGSDVGEQFVDFFENIGDIKDKLRVRLVNGPLNKEYLKDKIHMNYIADIEMVLYFEVAKDGDGVHIGSPTSDMLESFGLDTQQAVFKAIENTPLSEEPVLKSVMDALFGNDTNILQQHDPDLSQPPFVLQGCGCANQFGASVMLSKYAMERTHYLLGDFVILPSSVHELLVMPLTNDMDAETLRGMVHEVNKTVADEDILSENVFVFYGEQIELFE